MRPSYSVSSSGGLTALGNTTTDAGTVDAAAAGHGRFLYVQTGAAGIVDEFAGGGLTPIGSVTVAGAAGGEGGEHSERDRPRRVRFG